MHRAVPDDFYEPGFHVHVNDGHDCGIRIARKSVHASFFVGRVIDIGIDEITHSLETGLHVLRQEMNRPVSRADDFHNFDGAAGIIFRGDLAICDVELLRNYAKASRRDSQHLLAHFLCRHPSRRHQHHRRPAAAGAETVGRRQSVAVNHVNLFEWNSRLAGDDLRDGGLMALPLLAHAGKNRRRSRGVDAHAA